jgi:hypothetical protein
MDTLRGIFDSAHRDDDRRDDYLGDDETGMEPPPAGIGTDERRMQVRAYNHWASLLDERNFPSIEDLEPDQLPDFGPYSVLLDFSRGIDDPGVCYLGKELAVECGADHSIATLSDVPARSLLSRITDHYMQILANQAPIGFEAEFVNQRSATILYRGILLPFSSDGETIDFIYGVINWKEMADQLTSDELLLEIDQALGEHDDASESVVHHLGDEVTDWADGPASDIVDLVPATGQDLDWHQEEDDALPRPTFGMDVDALAADFGEEDDEDEEHEGDERPSRFASLLGASPRPSGGYLPDEDDEDEDEGDWSPPLTHPVGAVKRPIVFDDTPVDMPVADYAAAAEYAEEQLEDTVADEPFLAEVAFDEPLGLHDCLAVAREMALAARSSEDRSRTALYDAVGRAYDVSLAAEQEPEEFAELIAESGLTMQDRAPMTPVVKLVFGADYDKTRLTEYATVLTHAHRAGIERGGLASYLRQAEGGLKGVVQAERRQRREESGETVEQPGALRETLARKLRDVAPSGFDAIAPDGSEFALVMIRRLADGSVVMLGEVPEDVPLIERAARKLVG